MKPTVQERKLLMMKKKVNAFKNENPAPPLSSASAALPSAAKQKKQQKKQLQALEKQVDRLIDSEVLQGASQQQPKQQASDKAAKLQQKRLQKKLKRKLAKQQQQQPPSTEPAQRTQQQENQAETHKASGDVNKQLSKKRKPELAKAAEKRPRMESATINGGSKLQEEQEQQQQQAPKEKQPPAYQADTGPVRDPVVRAEIAACLRHRAACTVRVKPLPNRLRPAQVTELCKGIQAARVPWNYATGRNKGVAFLEFASPEAAERALAEISAAKTLGTRLTPAIVGSEGAASADVDIDAYNCRRVAVSSLHPRTTGQELKDLVGGTALQRVDFLMGSKNLRKHAPAVAFLTFADERRALEAVKKFQGHVIRTRATSWLFQKRTDRPEHARHPTQLVAFGVSKRVTDADILKAFPRSQSIDVKQDHGMAVVTYASEAECRGDFEACKGGVVRVGKAKLRVQYGHAQYKPLEQRKKVSAPQAAKPSQPIRKQPQQPPKPLNIDPSLFNKCQLVVKNFKPATQEADLTAFLPGTRRVFFTGNRRLAFVHFHTEAAATEALEKLAKEPLNGAKLKAMYAMDKPDKKVNKQEAQGDVSMTEEAAAPEQDAKPLDQAKQRGKFQPRGAATNSQRRPGVGFAKKARPLNKFSAA